MAADDDGYLMTPPSVRTRSSETPVLAHPALYRRDALRERRPRATRRHTGRVATRFTVLLAGDVLAILLARAVALWLMTETAFGAVALPGTPLINGGTRFVFLAILTLAAVFATGGHSRHRALNQPMRLFFAVAGAVLLNYAGGIARGFLSDLVLPMIATAGRSGSRSSLVRQLSEWFLRQVWPGQRGAGAAILVGAPIASRRFEQAIAAPGGDYRVVGYVATDRADTDDFLGTVEDLPSLIDEHDVEAVVVCADLPLTRISTVIEECLHAGCQILYPGPRRSRVRCASHSGLAPRPALLRAGKPGAQGAGAHLEEDRRRLRERDSSHAARSGAVDHCHRRQARLTRLSLLLSGACRTRRPPLPHDQVPHDAGRLGYREAGACSPEPLWG